MKKTNILIKLLFVFVGISVFDINAAARIVGNADEKHIVEEANKLLLNAIQINDVNQVKAALLIGADVNVKNEYGNTPLIQAAIFNYIDIFKLLLERGADISIKNNDKHTVLDFVSKNPELLSEILQNYQKICRKIVSSDEKKETIELANTLLLNSAANGNLTILKKAIEFGANLEVMDKEGATALINASLNGFASIVELLLQNGAKVNAHNFFGDTSLIFASQKGNLPIVELLLKYSADVNTKNMSSETALIFATFHNFPKIVERLIENKADINSKNISGFTPLMYSFDLGLPKIAKLLIKNGVDVSIKNKDGKTAFDFVKGNAELEAIVKAYRKSHELKKDTESKEQLEVKESKENLKTESKDEAEQAELQEAEQEEIETKEELESEETPEPKIEKCKCGIELPSDELKIHSKQHNKIKTKNICKQGICQNAPSYFTTKQKLSAHTKEFHKHESKVAKEITAKKSAENICDLCGVKCANNKSLKLHKSNHDKIETEHICKVDTCEKAPSYFRKKPELRTHQEQCHDIKHQNPQKPKKLKEPKKEEVIIAKAEDQEIEEPKKEENITIEPKVEPETKESKKEYKTETNGLTVEESVKYLNDFIRNKKFTELEKFLENADYSLLNRAFIIAFNTYDIENIDFMIKLGADVNVKDDDGKTLLPIIVGYGLIDIAELFLKNGANPNIKNNGSAPLIIAIENGFEKITKLLLDYKADVNIENNKGDAALIVAVSTRNAAMVELLLNHGANVNAKNKDGISALEIAVHYNLSEIIELLLKYKADFNKIIDSETNTLLMNAIIGKNKERVELLLKFGAEINVQNKYGNSALAFAVNEKNLEITKILIEHKADVDQKNNEGNTPLMLAAALKNFEIVNLLLNAGANVNAVNSNNDTALMVAAAREDVGIVKLLLEKGADIKLKNNKGMTASDFAIKKRNKIIIELLLPKKK